MLTHCVSKKSHAESLSFCLMWEVGVQELQIAMCFPASLSALSALSPLGPAG